MNIKMPAEMPYRFKWELVTPDRALWWLQQDHRARNRCPGAPRVMGFALMILHGEWKPVPNPILIRQDGRLGNGQHRMAGIVLAGELAAEQGLPPLQGVPVLFCFDVPEPVILEMDRGRAQSLADTEVIAGDALAKTKTEIARVMLPVEGRPNSTLDRCVYRDIVRGLGEEHLEAIVSIPHKKSVTAPVRAALAFARPIHPQAVDAFAKELIRSFEHGTDNTTINAVKRVLSAPPEQRELLFKMVLRAIQVHIEGGKALQYLKKTESDGYPWACRARMRVGLQDKVVPEAFRPDLAEGLLKRLNLQHSRR